MQVKDIYDEFEPAEEQIARSGPKSRICVYLSLSLPTCLSIFVSIYPFIHPSIHPSILMQTYILQFALVYTPTYVHRQGPEEVRDYADFYRAYAAYQVVTAPAPAR